MDNIEVILSEENLNFENIKKFIEEKNEDNYYKILHRIHAFDEESQKKVCKEVIIRSDNENIVEQACMEIITFINYNYDYYKEIIEIISKREYHGTWIDEIIDKLIEDSTKTIQYVFEDFSMKIPDSIDFDIKIIERILSKYDKKYIEDLNLERKQAIVICSRLNYIITINYINVLNIYYGFDNKFKFSKNEIKKFLDEFFFNFPYICKKFIEKNSDYDENLNLIKYLKNIVKEFEKEEKIKFDMKIFLPDKMRIYQYRKYQLKQNKEINTKAKQYSSLLNLCKSNTILYGKKYGVTVTTKDENKVSVSNLHEFKYEYPYALKYIIDPVEYMIRMSSLKNLRKEN